MSVKSVIFVTTNTQYRRESSLVNRYAAFLLSELFNADKTALLFTVNGSQSVWPCIGCWSRRISNAVSLFVTYQSGKDYISVQRIKRPTQMRNNTVKGTPKGDSASAYADIQQIIKTFFEDVSDADKLEDSLFEMFQSTLFAMADMGYDEKALLRFCWVYRRTSKFLADLENSVTNKRNKTTIV